MVNPAGYRESNGFVSLRLNKRARKVRQHDAGSNQSDY